MPESTNRAVSPAFKAILALCVLLAALDVVLALRVRDLTAEVARLRADADMGMGGALTAGDVVQPVMLLDQNRDPTPVSFERGNGSVLLLFSSGSCDYCEVARPIWAGVAENLQSDRLRIVEIVQGGSPEMIAGLPAPYEVCLPGGDILPLLARVPGTPSSVLIGEGGVVIRAFYGEQAGLEGAVRAHLLDEQRAQQDTP